jgi:hypothetical protein
MFSHEAVDFWPGDLRAGPCPGPRAGRLPGLQCRVAGTLRLGWSRWVADVTWSSGAMMDGMDGMDGMGVGMVLRFHIFSKIPR